MVIIKNNGDHVTEYAYMTYTAGHEKHFEMEPVCFVLDCEEVTGILS